MLEHLLLRIHRSVSTTNVTARSPEGSHTVTPQPFLDHRLASPIAPLSQHLLLYVSSSCPARKKDTKTTKQQRKPPPSHSLSRAVGRRWVLASLSRPALVSTSPLALTQTTGTRRRTGKSKVLVGHSDPKLHSQPPASSTTRTSPTVASPSDRVLYMMFMSHYFHSSPVHPRIPEP